MGVGRKLVFGFICLNLLLLESLEAIPGGWGKADPESEEVQKAIRFAVSEHEKQSNSMFTSQLVKITKAERQIVAGVNYRVFVEIGYTNCRKNEIREPGSCLTQQRQSCKFVVYEQPWLSRIQLTETKCGPIKSISYSQNQVPSPGGSSETDSDEAAAFAVLQLQSFSNGLYLIKLKSVVEKTTRKNDGGAVHQLKIECTMSSCKSSRLLDNCKDELRNENVTCDVEVLDQQPKDPQYVLRKYKCTGGAVHKKGQPREKNIQVIAHLEAFEDFKKRFGVQYKSMSEESFRFNVFEDNLDTIKFLQEHELGTATYGVTQFADLTPSEFRKRYLTPYWDQSEDRRLTPAEIPKVTLPTDYDWRHYNAVTAVKNQGSCGSCWAFSVTGNIEGQWALRKKQLIPLSEQELVDCDKLDSGCNGGLPSYAYEEIQRLGGLETETDYPYKGQDEKCILKQQDIRVYINGSLNISKDETEMAAWLYKNGPLSIGINAFAMQFYFGGVSHPWKLFCSGDFLDHGVLIVGFGIHKGYFGDTPYWAVKNSWGTWWGEKGYYLVYRGDGTCGLNNMVSSAIVK